jgi:hypothetical protein
MSTAAEPALAADLASTNLSPKPKHKIMVTRGAAYLLEGIAQSGKVFPKQEESEKGSKLRRILRTQNPARSGAFDFEKGEVFNNNDVESANKRLAWNDAYNAWREGTVILELTNKQKLLAQKGIKLAFQKREEFGLLPENNDHTESLIVGFELSGSDEEAEE